MKKVMEFYIEKAVSTLCT